MTIRYPTSWLVALSTSCVTAPTTVPVSPQTYVLGAPIEQVWVSALIWFSDANIPIESMDRASGFIRSAELVLTGGDQVAGHTVGDLVDCGSEMGFARTTTGTTFVALTVLMQPQGVDSTSIRVRSAVRNLDDTSLGNPNTRCVSKGLIEHVAVEWVTANVATAK